MLADHTPEWVWTRHDSFSSTIHTPYVYSVAKIFRGIIECMFDYKSVKLNNSQAIIFKFQMKI